MIDRSSWAHIYNRRGSGPEASQSGKAKIALKGSKIWHYKGPKWTCIHYSKLKLGMFIHLLLKMIDKGYWAHIFNREGSKPEGS